MAKGRLTNSQSTAVDLIEDFLESKEKTLSWKTIVAKIKAKHRVADPRFDWMTIRKILQFYLNEELIARSDDLNVEEYEQVTDPLDSIGARQEEELGAEGLHAIEEQRRQEEGSR